MWTCVHAFIFTHHVQRPKGSTQKKKKKKEKLTGQKIRITYYPYYPFIAIKWNMYDVCSSNINFIVYGYVCIRRFYCFNFHIKTDNNSSESKKRAKRRNSQWLANNDSRDANYLFECILRVWEREKKKWQSRTNK